MFTATILLGTFENAKQFVQICSEQPFNIEVSAGNMVVHAKSIIGVLSMDLTEPMKLTVKQGNAAAVEQFAERITPFTV
jgi:phosphotransferase system HPr-like phosphotransfer protein